MGSTRLLATPNGSPVQGTTAYYLPYGDYRGSAPTATPLTERGYTGHHENREIGLTYMNARFYSPTSGRFLTADTLIPSPANPQAHNRYTYSLGNPIRFIDPSGHETVHANLSKDEAQILADAIALLLMEHDSLQVSVIEFLLSHFGPAVLSGATTYAVTEALVAAGFIAAGVVGVGISIGISVIVGAAIAWDKVATQNAMNTLRNVHQSLLNAINIAENTDRISIFAASTWFSSDRVEIMINGFDPSGNIHYGQKYYDRMQTGIINSTGKIMVSLIMNLTTFESGVHASVIYNYRYEYKPLVHNNTGHWTGTYDICTVYSGICARHFSGSTRR
ncbi:MAG: RHS repeat-associated core domain-containing protein [Anaerolineae bacterium]|nr:RHS repeat-associated core domain-containing protein [Anaerolineae bacterium]